jgi:hypothetical protein
VWGAPYVTSSKPELDRCQDELDEPTSTELQLPLDGG